MVIYIIQRKSQPNGINIAFKQKEEAENLSKELEKAVDNEIYEVKAINLY